MYIYRCYFHFDTLEIHALLQDSRISEHSLYSCALVPRAEVLLCHPHLPRQPAGTAWSHHEQPLAGVILPHSAFLFWTDELY